MKRKVSKVLVVFTTFFRKNYRCSILHFDRVFHNKMSRDLLMFEGKLELTLEC